MGRVAAGPVKDKVIAVRVTRREWDEIQRRKGPLTHSQFLRAVIVRMLKMDSEA